MTQWRHKCSLDWMKARQKYLTATDLREYLLPVTKTGRARKITDENYLKVMAKKLYNITEQDCISTGAAARGHILEPYAIDLYNANSSDIKLHHWDDVVIVKDESRDYGLAFSPDALDVVVPGSTVVLGCNEVGNAEVIGEVKSYSHERHLVCCCTPKDQLEERWQVAVAMAVCENIKRAFILFYDPSMNEQLGLFEYMRDELEDEIDMILEAERQWLQWVDDFFDGLFDYSDIISGPKEREVEIIKAIMKSEDLNPEGERSVVL